MAPIDVYWMALACAGCPWKSLADCVSHLYLNDKSLGSETRIYILLFVSVGY